jgi:hypothetical protein
MTVASCPKAKRLLGYLSPVDFGERDRYNNIKKPNFNRKVAEHARKRELGINARGLKTLDAAMLVEHAEGVRTLFGTASRDAEHLLIGIDVDNHRNLGTYDDAFRCLSLAIPEFAQRTFVEPSTNGRGAHGYHFILNSGDWAKNKAAFDHYALYLDSKRQELVEAGVCNVEKIEIKGRPGRFVRDCSDKITRNISGQLIKIPRGFRDRAEEFENIPVVTTDQILALKIPKAAEKAARENQAQGSAGGDIFGRDELAKLKGVYLRYAETLLAGRTIEAANRCVVTAEDVAIFIMILLYFHKHRNADHTLPTKRWARMWSALHKAKVIGRAWHSGRFSAIRDLLDESGCLEWEDESYVVGIWVQGDDGNPMYMKGRASKWTASEKLSKALEEPALRETLEPRTDRPKHTHSLCVSTMPSELPRADILATLGLRSLVTRPRFAGFIYGRRLIAA